MSASDWIKLITIPVFTGVVGWLINWTGLMMLFSPVRFHGVTVPGMRQLSAVLPRKLQEVPGILQGGIGWQGIVPARAAKMGSIAVDKAIAKLGTPADFYQQLEPDKIAEHIVTVFEPDMPEMIDRDHAPRAPAAVARPTSAGAARRWYARVQAQLPGVVRSITDEIGEHIDQLLDPKLMVIDHFEQNPALVTRIFRDFGQKELRPDGQLRVRLRLRARHPGGDHRPLVRPVVAAAGARRDRRLDDQRARHVA